MDQEKLAKAKKLTPIELRQALKDLPGWEIEKDRLQKTFRFQNFARAMVFLNKIVNPIEENQNYPRILIAYDRVVVSLFNNVAGGITVIDLEMAKEMDSLSGLEPEESEGIIKA